MPAITVMASYSKDVDMTPAAPLSTAAPAPAPGPAAAVANAAQPVLRAVYKFNDGGSFLGKWLDNQPVWGKYRLANGQAFQGNFENWKMVSGGIESPDGTKILPLPFGPEKGTFLDPQNRKFSVVIVH